MGEEEWIIILMSVTSLLFITGLACLCYSCWIARCRNVYASSIIDAQSTPAFEEISLRAANSALSLNNEHSPGRNNAPVVAAVPQRDAEDVRLRSQGCRRYSLDDTSISNSDTMYGDAGDRGSPSGDGDIGSE
ncbi:uncharacterized protein [Choristoneura fumiferana]|uniref:uncharacterized protein n=1 Tax=Choristoneura fumiferana TaxID=7141 RepID=UPI003D15E695